MKEHKISLTTAILLNINILIGSGILIGPGQMAAIAGNASFLCWPLVALFFIPIVLSMATLSRMVPGAGGFYAYAREGINTTAGFMSGWMYVVGYTLAVATEILFFRETIISSVGHSWLTDNPTLFYALFTIVVVGLNSIGFHILSKLLNSLTLAKLLPLVILICLLPFILNTNFTITAAELQAVPFALPFAIFGFFGFEYCCTLTHLIEDSEKNAPRAIVLGFLITGMLYTLFHVGLLQLMGAENLAQWQASSFASFITLPIPGLKAFLMFLIPLAAILTIFAATNGMMNANVMVLEALGRDNLLVGSSWLAQRNRFGRPWFAVMLDGVIAFLVVITVPSLNVAGNLCNMGIISAFILPCISLYCMQVKRGAPWSQKFLTVLAICITFAVTLYSWSKLGNTFSERMLLTVPMLVVIAVGYALYCARPRATRPA